MFVLDTNHVRELTLRTPLGLRLQERLDAQSADCVIAIVSAEETLRGWLARLASARQVPEQINGYRQLADFLEWLAEFTLLRWDEESAARFAAFTEQGVRIGTLDLRIACITLEHDATLLTRNAVDFAKVPGLRWENWLD
jgi:tRNA(fMet)-specific endonuclease VapC